MTYTVAPRHFSPLQCFAEEGTDGSTRLPKEVEMLLYLWAAVSVCECVCLIQVHAHGALIVLPVLWQ